MRKTRLLLALAFAALLLSSCGNKKQDDTQNKDEFLNTAAIGAAEELKIDGRRESQYPENSLSSISLEVRLLGAM